jgi:G1/S-specific cyclin PLC1
LPSLEVFIKQTVIDSNTAIPNLFVALVYLDRFGSKLAAKVNGAHDSRHRIFLACLVVACKFLNDVTYKNEYWASLWREFTVEDINLMERELLVILNFNLTINPRDMDNLVRRYFRYEEARRLEKTLFTHQPWFSPVKT